MKRLRLIFVACCPLLAFGELAAQNIRFTAVLADGRRVRGDEVRPWHSTSSRPTLDGVDLFDVKNPASWLRDESLPTPRAPRAFVEFVGGDVLPGQVVAFSRGDDVLDEPSLPYVLVEPEVSVEPLDAAPRSGLRVLTRWLRRVVWTPHLPPSYQPSTLFYRDGSSIAFRSVRFADGEVRVLLPEGIRRVPFDQIAELHFERLDPWNAYFEQVAILSPGTVSRLQRIETVDGLRLTSSVERFRAMAHGSRDEPKNWQHVLQPAWSLDPVWLPHRSIRTRVYHRPSRVPLSHFAPLRIVRRSILGGSWRWRRDRSVQGGALVSGGAESAWGFGVQAHSELEFPLHVAVRTVSTRVGLDHAVATGGCVKTHVLLRPKAPPEDAEESQRGGDARDLPRDRTLWSSGLLIGSAQSASSGPLSIPKEAAGDGMRLVLVADAAVDVRPAGADPFDVRDSVDWLEPVVELDESILRDEVFRRFPAVLPSFSGWAIFPERHTSPLFVNRWDESLRDARAFRLQLALNGSRVELVRREEIDARRRWFFASASRISRSDAEVRLELAIDGVDVAGFSVPRRTPSDAFPQALTAPLASPTHGESEIRVRITGDRADAEVDVRALRFTRSVPGVTDIFEDDLGERFESSRVDGVWLREWRAPFRGTASLKVLPTKGLRLEFLDQAVRVRERPQYGEFRYLRFAWKKVGGGRVGIGLGHDGNWGANPARARQSFLFDQGRGDLTRGVASRVSRETATKWTQHSIDLVQVLGEFSMTGIEFVCPDGEFALFDHVWLARTRSDWDRAEIPELVDPEVWRAALARDRTLASPDSSVELHTLIAPDFDLLAEATALAEYRERPAVLRTAPSPGDASIVWKTRARIDDSSRARLALSVAHDVRGAWFLEVRVDDVLVFERLVGPSTTADGWLDVNVPLSRFFGREVKIEVAGRSRGRAYAFAYWWLVRLQGVR